MAKAPPQAPPKSDAYTGMLILSLLALVAGCVFLYLDFSQYPSTKPPTVPAMVPRQAPTGPAQPGGPGAPGAPGAPGVPPRMP
jgi:hypothetical protein